MRISDWSSDVCSSDLPGPFPRLRNPTRREPGTCHARDQAGVLGIAVLRTGRIGPGTRTEPADRAEREWQEQRAGGVAPDGLRAQLQIGSASCRERVWPYV